MKLPIVFNIDGVEEPDTNLFFKIAANGIFKVRKTPFYRATTRTDAHVPGLLPGQDELEYELPRLPKALLEDTLAFFAHVYREHRGEAIVILFYNHENQEYRIGVPPQRVPGYYLHNGDWRAYLELDYGVAPRPEGFLRLGTIHSHAYMSAYASATDHADESHEDGLHIVYGAIDRVEPSRCAAFVADKVRFNIEPDEILEPCSVPDRDAPPAWMDQVQRKKESWTSWYTTSASSGSKTKNYD